VLILVVKTTAYHRFPRADNLAEVFGHPSRSMRLPMPTVHAPRVALSFRIRLGVHAKRSKDDNLKSRDSDQLSQQKVALLLAEMLDQVEGKRCINGLVRQVRQNLLPRTREKNKPSVVLAISTYSFHVGHVRFYAEMNRRRKEVLRSNSRTDIDDHLGVSDSLENRLPRFVSSGFYGIHCNSNLLEYCSRKPEKDLLEQRSEIRGSTALIEIVKRITRAQCHTILHARQLR
jgi:hypothetical protein